MTAYQDALFKRWQKKLEREGRIMMQSAKARRDYKQFLRKVAIDGRR